MPNPWFYPAQSDVDDQIRAKFKILFDGYRKMLDQSISKSKDLDDMLRFLPGVVVQKGMTMQGMVALYRIKPDLLEHLIKSTIMIEHPPQSRWLTFRNYTLSQLLKLSPPPGPQYILDDYLSGFLQDRRDRSQLYYCDPILQHISICHHFLSLLDGSNAFDLQS